MSQDLVSQKTVQKKIKEKKNNFLFKNITTFKIKRVIEDNIYVYNYTVQKFTLFYLYCIYMFFF